MEMGFAVVATEPSGARERVAESRGTGRGSSPDPRGRRGYSPAARRRRLPAYAPITAIAARTPIPEAPSEPTTTHPQPPMVSTRPPSPPSPPSPPPPPTPEPVVAPPPTPVPAPVLLLAPPPAPVPAPVLLLA